MEKIISTTFNSAEKEINPLLESGWNVKQMVSENVSVSNSISATGTSRDYFERDKVAQGKVIFVLQKN